MKEGNVTRKPHKHADCIKAWADGLTIQVRNCGDGWVDMIPGSLGAMFKEDWSYRVKPKPEFPKSSLMHKDWCKIYEDGEEEHSFISIANEAIKHFIVSGDIDKYIEGRGE